MEPQIEEIYSQRVAIRGQDARYAQVLQSIHRVSSRLNVTLRSDAVYFLANNIAEMVIDPLIVARETTSQVSVEELVSYIESDLPPIIEAASSAANARDRQRISATSVIIGLGKVIDNLKINSAKLWGR